MASAAEHLKWAKDRALEYAPPGEKGDAGLVIASLASDFAKHSGTAHSAQVVVELMMPLAMIGEFERPGELRKFIEGFN